MNIGKTILFSVIITLLCCSAAFADGPYVFELSDARTFQEKTENGSIDIAVPRIIGMADGAAQQKLNEYFLSEADEVIAPLRELGVNDFIKKPYSMPDFSRILAQYAVSEPAADSSDVPEQQA